jgi:speckle-type POZ protein
VTIAISNRNDEKIFPQRTFIPRGKRAPHCVYEITKTDFDKNFFNGTLVLACKIEQLITTDLSGGGKLPTAANSPEKPFSNSNQLAFAGMENIFETMKFADITLYVCGCQFRAHKIILATRSPFFAAMFQYQTEDYFSEPVEIEDVEPLVFREILHFISTGRLSESEMKSTMPFEILKVAAKYLLDQLKMECETQLIHRISADNCMQLLFFTEENHSAFYLKKHAIQFFRNFSSKVMATEAWEKVERDHPKLCLTTLKKIVETR